MRAAPTVAVSRTLGRLILWLSPRNQATRIPVHAALPTRTARNACFAKVETALGLMARFDPLRLHRLETDLTAIVVWPAASFAGSLNAVTRICLLNRSVVDRDRAGIATATVLVHEAMHARLVRLGLEADAHSSPRIERACKRAELHFLLRLPPFTGRDDAIAAAQSAVAQTPIRDHRGRRR